MQSDPARFSPHFFCSALRHPPAPAAMLQCWTAIVINSWESCIPTHPFLHCIFRTMQPRVPSMLGAFLHCMLIFCSVCSLPVSPKFQILCSYFAQRHHSVHKDEWFCLGEVVFRHYSVSAQCSPSCFALSKCLQMVVNMGTRGCTQGGMQVPCLFGAQGGHV
jgi:hypothetical protein